MLEQSIKTASCRCKQTHSAICISHHGSWLSVELKISIQVIYNCLGVCGEGMVMEWGVPIPFEPDSVAMFASLWSFMNGCWISAGPLCLVYHSNELQMAQVVVIQKRATVGAVKTSTNSLTVLGIWPSLSGSVSSHAILLPLWHRY